MSEARQSQNFESKKMDASEQIRRFKDFIEANYYPNLLEAFRKGLRSIVVDFNKLIVFDTQLAEEVLETPEDVIKAFDIALNDFDSTKSEKQKKMHVRFNNLPSSQRVMVRNIRSEHLGQFIALDGIVRQKSDVRPQVTTARFECPSCGNVISVIQLDVKFKEPTRCGCGRKGKFFLLSKELVDAQNIVLEESPEKLEGGEQPKRMNIFLKEDLVSPLTDKKTNPGTRIVVNGFVKEVPISLNSGGTSTKFELLVEANYVDSSTEDFSELVITKEEEEEILELAANNNIQELLINSVAPSIYGHRRIKEALLYQMVSGVHKVRGDGVTTRGDMHILLIGDPGAGKSQMLKRIAKIAPKARFVSGKGASGAGLTAAVVKDEFLKGWSLEAGALVLANKGICCIDELDKMSVDDRSAMHEALEGQTITISKANIQATLRAETTVLAAANPKFGRFDPYETIAKQIDLPPTLINRFDLIFPIRDLPDRDKDEKMANFILKLHKDPTGEEPEISTEMVRKYIAYARQNINPVLTDGAIEEIREYFLKMRSKGMGEGERKSIPISARQLEGLVRIAESVAKLRLSNKVTKKDAKQAVDLLHYSLSQVGIDPETGEIDIDRIATGITSSERNKIINIREIITELEGKFGRTIPMEEIIALASQKGMGEDKVEEAIEKLKKSGDIFEPRRGFISKI
jgi:replicative DNA helicase Mcm